MSAGHADSVRRFHEHQFRRGTNGVALQVGDTAKVMLRLGGSRRGGFKAPAIGEEVTIVKILGGIVYPAGFNDQGWDAAAFEKVGP